MSMLGSVLHLLDTASMPDYFRIIKVSERNTYPKMPRIIAHCVIEVKEEGDLSTPPASLKTFVRLLFFFFFLTFMLNIYIRKCITFYHT